MSDWYWKVIALKAAFVLTCIVSSYSAEDTVQQLPFCNPHSVNTDKNDLMIVSTLDGKLTAFATESGDKVWEIETQPLLSSNLHHVELTSGGKWVRLVPSLRGTLYSLSGDNIEPLPFDADQLLSSSFKYSDDLVVAGAKESLWQGIDTATGSVLYSCGSGGCSSEQQAAGAGRRVLVLRRHSNTVRALDPRSGQEKWNFSVAEHHLALSSSPDCLGPAGSGAGAVDIRVAVPEGTLAVARDTGLWRAQLEAPIAGMWRLEDGALKTIDVMWECTRALTDDSTPPPSLYIGVHRTQLYIQESQLYAQKLETSVSTKPLPWKLMQTRPLIEGGETALTVQESPQNALSLITLYGANGQTTNHGFFLYLQETCDQSVQVSEDLPPSPEGDHHHIHVHVYSLWFWWKEVLLIAISSALLMNLMIWPRFFAPKFRAPTPLPSDHQEYIVVERHYDRPPSDSGQYCGRYFSDFTPLRCLGRGGFGVVFEARNNIDRRSYAVKRITLPSRESKRERVLREVRALAKLEHENIVRYFNSWVEEPPPNWQEQKDAIWKRELNVSLEMSEDYTVESPSPIKTPLSNSVKLNLDKCCDALDYEKQLTAAKRNRSLSCNESFSIIFDENPKSNDDSFIVFANENTKASQGSKGPTDVSKGLSNGSKGPTDVSKGPSNVSKGPTDVSKGPSNGSKGPTDVSKGPSDASKGPSDVSKGFSEARKDSSLDKRLERVKECDSYVNNDTTRTAKKKKVHTRHWSLDMVVRREETPLASKMYLYIQMQLCRRDSLHDWLRQNRTRASRGEKVRTLFSQIVSAVEYVHLEGLIHRDLKPSNIFFAPDGRVKVGDFGLVTTMGDNSQDGVPDMDVHARHTYRVGTHLYMSPEQLAGRPYSYKVDIYSLGVILFELLQPFDTESERVARLTGLRAGKYPGHFQEQCPKETEVLKLMLSEDPAKRPTASGVRARAPLYQPTEEKYHFNLPTPVSA